MTQIAARVDSTNQGLSTDTTRYQLPNGRYPLGVKPLLIPHCPFKPTIRAPSIPFISSSHLCMPLLPSFPHPRGPFFCAGAFLSRSEPFHMHNEGESNVGHTRMLRIYPERAWDVEYFRYLLDAENVWMDVWIVKISYAYNFQKI